MAGPRTLAAILPAVTRKALGKRGMAFGSLLAEWASIVGPRLADRTLPFRIVFPSGRREEGTLHLRVSTSIALDIQHFAPELMESINIFFGYRAVTRLKLMQAGRPLPTYTKPRLRPLSVTEHEAIDAAVATIPDAGLAAALARFGRTLAACRPATPLENPSPEL
jgi:hypothetical protein